MTDPVGVAMAWIAQYGVSGIFGIALLERMVPLIPSQLVLVAIGIGCADGRWPLGTALAITAAAGVCGVVMVYVITRAVFRLRFASVFRGVTGWVGVSPQRIDALVLRMHRGERQFALMSQLTPMVRILSPGVAGAVKLRLPVYLMYTSIGIVVWNATFLLAGWLAGSYGRAINNTVVAGTALGLLIFIELIVVFCLRLRGACVADHSHNC